jgi:hypothetical protein
VEGYADHHHQRFSANHRADRYIITTFQRLWRKITKIQMHLNTNTCTFLRPGCADALLDTECLTPPPYLEVLKSRTP